MVRAWCVLYILTWKCASRHNGVQLFISHLASWLRTRRFSEPTFRLSGATNHWKNTVFRDFPTFSRICIFFLLTLSLLLFSLLIFLFSLPLPCSAFHLSILSEVWLLNFLRSVYRWCSPVCCFKNVEFPMSLSYVPEGINIEIQRLVGQKISKKRIRGWSVGCCWNMWKPQGNVEVYTIETWHEQAVNPGSQLFGGAWWLDWSPCWKYVMHTY